MAKIAQALSSVIWIFSGRDGGMGIDQGARPTASLKSAREKLAETKSVYSKEIANRLDRNSTKKEFA